MMRGSRVRALVRIKEHGEFWKNDSYSVHWFLKHGLVAKGDRWRTATITDKGRDSLRRAIGEHGARGTLRQVLTPHYEP
jgi:hypothetical protein